MKKIFLITLFLFLLIGKDSFAQRLTGDNAMRAGTKSAVRENVAALNDTQKIENLKQKANVEIDRRIVALNKLIARLTEMKKLSSSQLATFKTDIQTNIDGLNALKVKINADTDLTTLREDVKSIVSDYYIFAFYIQYINLNAALDRASTTLINSTNVYDKLSARINELETAGKDVSTLKVSLVSMKTNLDNSKTTLDAATTELSSLSKDGFPDNKAALLDARSKLKSIRESLVAAHVNAKSIIVLLKSLIDNNQTVTPIQTPAL